MIEKSEVFKCKQCEVIVAVLKGGNGELVCCGDKMNEVTPGEAKRLVHGMQRPGSP